MIDANDNVYEYFKNTFGRPPRNADGTADIELRELGCDTNCGRDCCQVIDAGQALIAFTDPAVHLDIIIAIETDISIKFRG